MGRLRKLVNDNLLHALFSNGESDSDIAIKLTDSLGVPVRRQNVTYWRKAWKGTDSDHIIKFNTAAANREVRDDVEVRTPSPEDWEGNIVDLDMHDAILVIPDLHIPYHHPDAFEFIEYWYGRMKRAFGTSSVTVINLGDEVDNHAISFHDSDPNLDSAGTELHKSREAVAELVRIVPNMRICHSNHGSLHYRRAKAHGIPVEYLRTYREVLFPTGGGDGWDWDYSYTLDTSNGPVMFKHQCAGDPRAQAAHEGCNLVVGHNHGRFDLSYGASAQRLYWGATSGCLLDKDSLAFAYGRESTYKPILGVIIINNGIPSHMPMVLNNEGRWVGP